MKTSSALFLAICTLFILSSCSPRLTPFTEKLYNENGWTERDLEKIQFYLSDDIVLYRDVREGSSRIEDGKIRQVDGRKVEEIVIEKGTPGVLVYNPQNDRFGVSFENGSDERYLMFGPNPKSGNRYVLLAKEWKRNRGKLTYEGRTYYTNSESAYASLLVNLRKIKKTKVKRRTAEGRKL